MKITLRDVPDCIAFLHPSLSAELRAEKIARMTQNFSEYCGEEEMVFLSRNSTGAIEGLLFRVRLQTEVYAAANVVIHALARDEEIFRGLLDEAAQGVKKMRCRLISGPTAAGRKRVLVGLGFIPGEERREFRRDLAELPGDEESPFTWHSIADLSDQNLDAVADFLGACAVGDPDFSPDDKPRELLRVYLQERGLSADAACIQLGHIEGKPVAMVVAQVQAKDGWSRITYMGMLPEFRGRGLGEWVHRHGFTMMKDQGGKLYHGGTLAKNTPMIRLFEKHGCTPYRDMQEWARYSDV